MIPQAGQSDLWLQGAILRLVLVAWIVYCLLVFVVTGSGERLALLSILLSDPLRKRLSVLPEIERRRLLEALCRVILNGK